MPILIHHPSIRNFSLFTHYVPFTSPTLSSPLFAIDKASTSQTNFCRNLRLSSTLSRFRWSRVSFCAKYGSFEEVNDTLLPETAGCEESEELALSLKKPFPKQVDNGKAEEIEEDEKDKRAEGDILESFYKLFGPSQDQMNQSQVSVAEETEKVNLDYYEPKAGDFVVGVVVSGNENKLDVNVGADLLGTMLTKEVLPLSDKEIDYLLCDFESDAEFLVPGKVGIVQNDEALSGQPMQGKLVVEPGTVLFAEVYGRTLGGRPLLSARRLFRRMAWHRVRQIKQLNEPIEVILTEWNTGGLLTRIEGLRAFLPKAELMNRVNNYTEMKGNVGRRIRVLLIRVDEETKDLVLSEKAAWEMMNLEHGTLLEGTVKTVFPYGAQIKIGDTNRSGLLHITKITKGKVTSVSDLLKVDEKVKVLVVPSTIPDKICLSIADLESEPGLFLSDKEKVFSEAKEMAKKYRQKMSVISAKRNLEALPTNGLPFGDEESLYANWRWFKFERDGEINT
ncbi:Nucleic acid-binding proteins superfamily [Striga hermonthica]|uniref:Nucleic acid-binding proteins superfamily n=1 Tax=Striga hermonthica TaxID=68872 RepID=A0A9N7MMB0_STRHE|nr:Nucleic acid-binding proteins superfamily [Striga hermonthica]